MEAQINLYKVNMLFRMGVGSSDRGVFEKRTYYFADIGDVTFSDRIIKFFEAGNGEYGKGFKVLGIEELGPVMTTERKNHE